MTAPSARRRVLGLGVLGLGVLGIGGGRVGVRPARAAPHRLVAIGAAITEAVYALGQGPALVATDSSSLYPPAARALPQIGYMRALPTEGLVGLSPDLLLLSDQAGPPQVVEVLRASGLPMVIVEDGAGPQAAPGKVRAIAHALGVEGEAMAQAVAGDWALLDAPLAGLARRPRVVFVLSAGRGAPLVSGAGTHADALIAAAGGENPLRGFQGYRPLSAEAAAALAPDLLLMMHHALEEGGGRDAVLASPALAVTPAARAGRLHGIDPAALNFGPRAAQARRALAALLHPGLALPALPPRPWA